MPAMGFFSLFIGGFSLAFYLLLQQVRTKNMLFLPRIFLLQPIPVDYDFSFVGVETKKHHEFFFFDAPLTSFFKTLGMFVGEIEFADLPIDASSKLSFVTLLFLAVFLFAIVIVQMNLLNGLAVTDVGELQRTAEIRSIKARWGGLSPPIILAP